MSANTDQRHFVVAFWAFLFPISFSSTCSSPLPTSISGAFNSTGGLDFSRLCALHVSMYESRPLKATVSQAAATAHTDASVRTFDSLLWGRKCQSMQNQSFHIYVIHNFCTMGTVNIIAVCLRWDIGTHILHDKYSPVTCSRCAVIETVICACTENCWSPTCLW